MSKGGAKGGKGGKDDGPELSYWLKKQLKAFELSFSEADKDQNGFLSFEEIRDVVRKTGFKGDDEDLQKIFKFADTNKDAKISKSEYLQAMKKAPSICLKEIVLRRAFVKYDTDKSGYLTRDEIISIASSEEAGLDLKSDKIADMLKALITDADKKISYEEFLAIFNYNQTATLLRTIFDRIDKDKTGFLSKQNILDAIKSDDELSFNAANLSQLLITFSRDKTDKINYEEFARLVASQCKK